ncbi:MAG TPA: PhnD/SsuA/transferrin family substrate-binding protein, partial [Gammaproteobacteria bacterium]|nr:PhnD/SsuA/transferrin family substrate-binding protein [Gammaproteobacteria bacterium]
MESKDLYKIGVLAYKGKDDAMTRWQEHGNYLNQKFSPIQFKIIPLSYKNDEMTKAVERGQVDFIITNPGHYMELELGGHVSRLATRRMSGPEGILDQFGGTAITLPSRTDIEHYTDLEGKTVVIPSQSSLGGWQVHLREAVLQGSDLRNESKII